MNNMIRFIATLILFAYSFYAHAQSDRWQQRVEYMMDVKMNVKSNQYEGNQNIKYFNNSPDTLTHLFFHLYLNAFQPNSAMDIRSRSIEDPDGRVSSRISQLKKDEIGYINVKNLTINNKKVASKTEGTILEVKLAEPILPHTETIIEMSYDAQIPLQIRRSGRDNAEGVRYSMAQWYPKLCEYDYQGWHSNPYIGREFYGVWGDYDVQITIDKDYVIGATGVLQNANQIGYDYQDSGVEVPKSNEKNNVWHFIAKNVHDFVWAADPDYQHDKIKTSNGVTLHFFHKKSGNYNEEWKRAPAIMKDAFEFICSKYGEYPYTDYSFIQGGDGGMEYPMATLITGNRPLRSIVGVSVHELIHSWYQGVLGTNESLYAWMDEGFTSYASDVVMNYLNGKNYFPNVVQEANPFEDTYRGFINFAQSGKAENMMTHADHFMSNGAYSMSAYVYGEVFLNQLEYIVGKEVFDRALLRYYNEWKFKHPNANDFIRVFEKESDMELDWYKEYFVQSNHLIDYEVSELNNKDNHTTEIVLTRNLPFIMPIDVQVKSRKGVVFNFTIPLDLMRGAKSEDYFGKLDVMADWTWVNKKYNFDIPISIYDVDSVIIDPTHRLADANLDNNIYKNVIKIDEPVKPEEGMNRFKSPEKAKHLKKAKSNAKEDKE